MKPMIASTLTRANQNSISPNTLTFRVLIRLTSAKNTTALTQVDEENLQAQRRATAAQLKQARSVYERYKGLQDDESVSRQDFESAESTFQVQQANLLSLDAQIKSAHIQIDTAKINLAYTRIVAPIDGDVVGIVTQEGQTVIASQLAPVLLKLADLDTMTVKAQVSEADVIHISPGQKVYFTILGEADKRYKAVLLAAHHYPRFMPMLMTAAGTVKAARVLILGAGVAGLQAIATAKRLGAVIEASDVRPAVKEQIESLGAKFVDVPYETDEERECAVGVGGYARPMPASWMQRQALAVHERAKQADIVITTALIPGRKAPVLLSADTVAQMKPGSVVIDLAAAQGGNCPLTVADQVVVEHGVTIVGHTNLAAMVAADASALYARNLLDFLKLVFTPEGQFQINLEDDIVAACLMCRDGQVVRKNG